MQPGKINFSFLLNGLYYTFLISMILNKKKIIINWPINLEHVVQFFSSVKSWWKIIFGEREGLFLSVFWNKNPLPTRIEISV